MAVTFKKITDCNAVQSVSDTDNIFVDTNNTIKKASLPIVRGSGQGDTADVLKYTAQSLTDAQKVQARANIGALGESETHARDILYQSSEYAGQPTNVKEALDSLAQQSYFDKTEQYAQYESQVGGNVVDYLQQLDSDGEPLLADGLYYINKPENHEKTYARLFSIGNYGYLVAETYDISDGWVYKWEYSLRNGEWMQLKFESLGEESAITLRENDRYGTVIQNVAEPSNDLDAANKKYVDDATDGLATETEVEEISAKIPPQATSTNQLADKDFVNSSIENVAAYFITKDAAGNPFATKAELNAATKFYSGGQERNPTRNDYTVVLADESKTISATGENPTTRYIYDNGVWSFQYIVNNSGLTAAQWAAVNSGITSTVLQQLGDHTNLTNRDAADQHPIDAITGLQTALDGKLSEESILIVNADYERSTLTISNLDKTFAEIEAAYNGTASAPKKAVFLRAGNIELELKNFAYDEQARPNYDAANFVANVGQATLSYVMYRRDEWSYLNMYRTVLSISEQATNQETPTALAVYNYVAAAIGDTASQLTALDNLIGGGTE